MSFIGAGEKSAIEILQQLTGLPVIENRKLFFIEPKGIFPQIPITYILGPDDLTDLSEAHKKGSIDIFIKPNGVRNWIAVRIQGKGHGSGDKHHGKFSLKGPGKAQHDKVQKRILEKYCQVVDVKFEECPVLFKERVNETSIQEIKDSFKTARVEILNVTA